MTYENMSANFFLKLLSELRNRVYELCLLLQEPIDPWIKYNQRQKLTHGLLRVSREASSLFYAQNRFDFTMATPGHIASFLARIGHHNADCIRHVCVDFPNFRLNPGGVTLGEGDISIFASIQSSCANLSTLTMAPYSTYNLEDELEELDNPEIVTEALKLINTCFRAISSLQKIIVIVYGDGPSSFIKREMKNHEWKISITEYGKEWDTLRSLSNIEDN